MRSRRTATPLALTTAATIACLVSGACGFTGLGEGPDDAATGPTARDPGADGAPNADASDASDGNAALPVDATTDAVVLAPPLTVTVGDPPTKIDLDAEGTAGWIHFGTQTDDEDSFDEKASALGALPRFTVTGSTDVRTYEDNITTFTWKNGAGMATQAGTRNGVYSKTGFPIFHLVRTVGIAAQRWVVYAGVYKCKAKLTVKLGNGASDPKAEMILDNNDKGYARYVIEHRAPGADTPLTVTWELTNAYDSNNSNVTLAAQTLALLP